MKSEKREGASGGKGGGDDPVFFRFQKIKASASPAYGKNGGQESSDVSGGSNSCWRRESLQGGKERGRRK